jgi:hypothetical protein
VYRAAAGSLTGSISAFGGDVGQILGSRLGHAGERECPVLSWASSGAMWVTGLRNGPPAWGPGELIAASNEATDAIELLSARLGRPVRVDAAETIAGRAGLLGLSRAGRRSAGGASRLLEGRDGWFVLTLARKCDIDSVPALLERDRPGDPWAAVAKAARATGVRELVERARLLGMPAALIGEAAAQRDPFRSETLGSAATPKARPVVVDLSALWAGPLCAWVLGRSGARIIKVESASRLDGARRGLTAFFDALHAGHESVVLDLESAPGRLALARIVDHADVVIESSRPRALEQLGLSPRSFLAAAPGRIWVSITGYGRDGSEGHRVAFGDDAAAAAGFVAEAPDGGPVFCGDAVADPVAGLYAAAAALGSIVAGGGHLIDVALAGAVAHASAGPADGAAHRVARLGRGRWQVFHGDRSTDVARPRPLRVNGRARSAGADTNRVLLEFGARC